MRTLPKSPRPGGRLARSAAAVTAVALAAFAGTASLAGASSVATGSAPFPQCAPNQAPPVLVGDTHGASIEGEVVDNQGRLYVTDLFGGRILRFDTPGSAFTVIATLPPGFITGGGGALALTPNGTLLVGTGADPRVFAGDILKPGAIYTVNVTTGALTPVASGFSAADGIAVAHDGTLYVTNDFGSIIGRVLPNGVSTPKWASFDSANGAVLSADDKYLYVSRTFVNPGVSRIPTADPTKPESLLDLTGTHTLDAPDGLTLDSRGRPIVPTDVSGDILRIDAPGKACELANKITLSSVIVYGKSKTGFAAGHLYRAGFDGKVYEIPSGFDAAFAAAAH